MTAPHVSSDRPRSRPTLGGVLVFVAVLAAAAILVALLSRRGSQPSDAPAHNHAAMTSGPRDTLREVRLGSSDARRIGVTFAEATRAPLGQAVRAVAEVTWDETRAATIALKVDGWVERLYVNFTGQPVRRGDPLLDLYSPMLVTAQEELLLARRLAADVSAGTSDAGRDAAELVESARRRLRYWDVPAEAIERLERSGQPSRTITLRAPVGGVVVEKPVTQGQ